MNLYPKSRIPVTEVKKFIIIFYIVGFLGFLLPFTNHIFIFITPFALLISTYLLALYHSCYTSKDISVFIVIFILGYFVEVIGVNTGVIFGSYTYGSALGLKLFHTPLLIGINWLFLTYTSVSLTNKLKLKTGLKLIVAPSFMLIYDLLLEQLAPGMDMWTWQSATVPVKNYIAWWIIGFVFVSLLNALKIDTKNPLAAILFACQFIFFVLLFLILKTGI